MALLSLMVLIAWLATAIFHGEWGMALGLVCTFVAGVEGGGSVMFDKIVGKL